MGTFSGVFTPSILTILGIILFLRLGFVVGNAGLGRALLIIAMANAISILTTVSLSAIATNLKVKGGGDYYLISRTLGLEFGGAIGIVLFLAQSVSIAFYCIGFGEVLAGILPFDHALLPQVVAALAVSFLFLFAWLGADWATKLQFVIMGILALALISFFVGGISHFQGSNLARNWSAPASALPFWTLFAIFFPAVTGFTQGVSMSGDLKDPGKSLPLGTFLAVGLSALVYFAAALLLSAAVPQEVLCRDYTAMKRVAGLRFLIDAGVISATLSSGMASFLGAPRILQSLARDRIFPFLMPFAKGAGAAGNPRRGVLLSAGIAFATVGLGRLNMIAPMVSMFFLISYGLLNIATFYEAQAASPSFRPRFRWFDKRLSLLGGVACLGAMLAIDLTAGAVAAAVLFSLYQYLRRTAGPARWADSRRSYHLQRAREHLIAASKEPEHPRDWRPVLLAISSDPVRRGRLLRFAFWLEGTSGVTTAVQILEGDRMPIRKQRAQAEAELRKEIARHNPEAFPLVVAAPDQDSGAYDLVQAFGIGPLRVNTVLFNWLERLPGFWARFKEVNSIRNLRPMFRYGCNIIILHATEEAWEQLNALPADQRRIDVWWFGKRTCRMMLLFAYLMTRSEEWANARIRVLAVGSGQDYEQGMEILRNTLDEVRITAEPEVVVNADIEAVEEQSANASMVFLPFRFKGKDLVGPFGGPVKRILSHLGIAAFGLAAEDIDLDAEPEEGTSAEIAAAMDAHAEATRRFEDAEQAAAAAGRDAEEKVKQLQSAAASSVEAGDLTEMEKAARDAMKNSDKAARRAAKAQAKMEAAARALDVLGLSPLDQSREEDSPSFPKGGGTDKGSG